MKGQPMRRSKRQFRPSWDTFEERVVMSVTPIFPDTPFLPGGHSEGFPKAPAWNFGPPGGIGAPGPEGWFDVSDDQNSISTSVLNGNSQGHWVTLAIYNAPGGGSGDPL